MSYKLIIAYNGENEVDKPFNSFTEATDFFDTINLFDGREESITACCITKNGNIPKIPKMYSQEEVIKLMAVFHQTGEMANPYTIEEAEIEFPRLFELFCKNATEYLNSKYPEEA